MKSLPPAELGGTQLYEWSWVHSFIYSFVEKWVLFYFTREIKGEKNQQPNSVSLPPSRPLFQSLSVVISLRLFCLCLFFCYFIHKTRISSQYPKGGRLNERGAVAGFVSHCSFLWADVLCSLNVYTEKPRGWNKPACTEQMTQSQFHHISIFPSSVQLSHPKVVLTIPSSVWISEQGLFLGNRLVWLLGAGWASAPHHVRTHPTISLSLSS